MWQRKPDEFPASAPTIDPTHPIRPAAREPIDPAPTPPRDHDVATTGSMSGTVRSGGAAPLVGAEVEVIDVATSTPTTITTDAAGSWSIAGLPYGRYVVAVTPPGSTTPFYAGAGYVNPYAVAPTSYPVGAGSPSPTVDVDVPVGAFTGAVFSTVEVVAGTVTFLDSIAGVSFDTAIGSEGTYSISFLPPTQFDVQVTLATPSTLRARVAQVTATPSTVPLDLVVPAGRGRMTGTIRTVGSSGAREPVVDLNVGVIALHDGADLGSTITDSDGTFVLTDLPDGSYHLYAITEWGPFTYGSGFDDSVEPTPVMIAGDGTTASIFVDLPTGRFSGIVHASIEPFASALARRQLLLNLEQVDGRFRGAAFLSEATISLRHLPVGTYRVQAETFGGATFDFPGVYSSAPGDGSFALRISEPSSSSLDARPDGGDRAGR